MPDPPAGGHAARSTVKLVIVAEPGSSASLNPSLRPSASIPRFSDSVVPTSRRTPWLFAAASRLTRSLVPSPRLCQSSLSTIANSASPRLGLLDVAGHADLTLSALNRRSRDQREFTFVVDVGEAPELLERWAPGRHQSLISGGRRETLHELLLESQVRRGNGADGDDGPIGGRPRLGHRLHHVWQ